MLAYLLLVDRAITNFLFQLPHNFILNSFFGFFSIKDMSFLIWVLIFFYFVVIEEKKHKEFIIFFILSLIISTFLANIVIKNIVHRPRPFHQVQSLKLKVKSYKIPNYELLITNYPNDFSFPSGHATFAFTAATILAYYDKKRKKIFYLIAVLIAFSRVYLGYHYFFDVILGAFLGWLIAKVILKIKN